MNIKKRKNKTLLKEEKEKETYCLHKKVEEEEMADGFS
jgi:hypothetical protein